MHFKLRSIMQQCATVYTDDHIGFRGCRSSTRPKHSVSEYVRDQAHTNDNREFLGNPEARLPRHIPTFRRQHLHRYVNEFATRHNMRPKDTEAIMRTGHDGREAVDVSMNQDQGLTRSRPPPYIQSGTAPLLLANSPADLSLRVILTAIKAALEVSALNATRSTGTFRALGICRGIFHGISSSSLLILGNYILE